MIWSGAFIVKAILSFFSVEYAYDLEKENDFT
jgi:hypothetical protein